MLNIKDPLLVLESKLFKEELISKSSLKLEE